LRVGHSSSEGEGVTARRRARWVALSLVFAGAGLVWAQAQPQPTGPSGTGSPPKGSGAAGTVAAGERSGGAPEKVTMDFDNVEIAEIVKAMAKLVKKRFVYDERVKGTVTVLSEEPVSIEQAYHMFESVLQLKGFTIVEGSTGELKIIPSREAKQAPLDMLRDEDLPSHRDLFATRLISLHYVKAATIEPMLRQFASSDASLIGDVRTNTLLVTDTGANIAHMLQIVAALDVPLFEEQIRVIQLEHASAVELTAQLREVFGSESRPDAAAPAQSVAANSIVRSRAQAAAAAAREAAAAAAREAGAGGAEGAGAAAGGMMGATAEPHFIPDPRTNSILVMAPHVILEQVQRIVTLLDYARPGGGTINIYRLKNADATEMAKTLASLAQGPGATGATGTGSGPNPYALSADSMRVSQAGSANPFGAALPPPGTIAAGSAGGPGGAAVTAVLAGDIRITAERATNALIIQSSAQQYAALIPVIEKLDVRRPQVLIEGLVLEVQVDKGDSLGTNLLYNTLFGGDQRGTGFSSSPTGAVPPPLSSSDPNALASAAVGALSNAVFTSTLLGRTVTFTDAAGHVRTLPVIEAVVQASQQNNDTNIMAAPQILTADNAEAQLVVGENRPFPTQQLSAVSPLQTVGTTTPSFQTSTQVERRDVGIKMRVTPQITEGDTVRLKIFAEVSNVTSDVNPLGPTTNNRQIENTVYVNDGESVMIGGIIQDKLTSGERKVPVLGDIPVLGRLFGSQSDTVSKTNLLLLLTPHVVRGPKDLEQLTLEKRERFRAAAGEPSTPAEREQRQKAIDAGLDVPLDPNPVRREIGSHTQRYPTERLPELRQEREQREQQRQRELEQQGEPDAARSGPQAGALAPEPTSSPKSPQAAPEPMPSPESAREPEGPGSAHGSYLVQLQSLESASQAMALLNRLQGLGYAGSVVLQRGDDDAVLYDIRLGPYPSEATARRAGLAVEKATKRKAFVTLSK
jgi:general secretion pathway protein D